jgi:hypothetical protein
MGGYWVDELAVGHDGYGVTYLGSTNEQDEHIVCVY